MGRASFLKHTVLMGIVTSGMLVVLATPQMALAKKSKKEKISTVRIIESSSSETQAQRDKRLKRECKGRVNAGACAGYTY